MSDSNLDSDRLLPADLRTREIARELYAEVHALPIVSPHGHVPAAQIEADVSFGDPAAFLVTPDHYVTRLLHASGVPLEELGLPRGGAERDPLEVWRRLCENWTVFSGTNTGYWLSEAMLGLLGLPEMPTADTAEESFRRIQSRLAEPAFRPRALLSSFGVEVLATTDDPLDDLDAHETLNDDPSVTARIVPTFRPDSYLDTNSAGWDDNVGRLGEVTGYDTESLSGLLEALESRRAHFISRGATSTDHGVLTPDLARLPSSDAAAIYRRCREGSAEPWERTALNAHLLYEMARMSARDGLVMALHAGVHRNHHPATFERFGADTGHDFPTPSPVSFVVGLKDVLADFGTRHDFNLVLFSVDETTWGREIAPLASFYPSVFIGAPWWFLDAPDAMRRFRSVTTEVAGFSRYSGFVDDTRALHSIGIRHDTARRVDSGFLAGLVAEGRLTLPEASRIAIASVVDAPRKAFKL